MGFLTNLMSHMIGESVGVDPRRLMRLAAGRAWAIDAERAAAPELEIFAS